MRLAVLSGQLASSIQGAHSSQSQLIVEIDTCSSADDYQQTGDDGMDMTQGSSSTLKLSSVIDLVADVGMRSAPIPTWYLVHKDRKTPPVTMSLRVSLVNVIIAAAAQLPKGKASSKHYCIAALSSIP